MVLLLHNCTKTAVASRTAVATSEESRPFVIVVAATSAVQCPFLIAVVIRYSSSSSRVGVGVVGAVTVVFPFGRDEERRVPTLAIEDVVLQYEDEIERDREEAQQSVRAG
jgi:hypothetical protein